MIEDKDSIYYIRENDNTLKQFFDRFYVLPKEKDYTKEEIEFLKTNAIYPTDEDVQNGRNGYITFRGKKPKVLTEDQCREILESKLSQRQLAEKFKVSVGTINKVLKGKY